MGYCIMRSEKVKTMSACGGLEREHNRTTAGKETYEKNFSPNIRWEKSDENIFLLRSNSWQRTIKEKLKEYGIEKWRKDAVMLVDSIYTATPDVLLSWSKEKEMDYFKDCLEFHERHYGVPINAVIHFDESSPHLHVDSVPIVKKEDGWKLSAKEIFGDRKKMSKLQSDFYEEVGKKYGLHRGIERSFAIHREVSRQLHEKNIELQNQINANDELICFQSNDIQNRENLLHDLDNKIDMNQDIIEKQRKDIQHQNEQISRGNEYGLALQDRCDDLERQIKKDEKYMEFSKQYDRKFPHQKVGTRMFEHTHKIDDFEMEM